MKKVNGLPSFAVTRKILTLSKPLKLGKRVSVWIFQVRDAIGLLSLPIASNFSELLPVPYTRNDDRLNNCPPLNEISVLPP